MDFWKKVVILCFEFSPYCFTKTNAYKIEQKD